MSTVFLLAVGCSRGFSVHEPQGVKKPGTRRTLRVAIGDPGGLAPPKELNRWAGLVLKQLCDTLVAFDPRTGALKPAIAESWTISGDSKKVTFRLRPGVRFHNGRPLTAEDYVGSLSRFVSPRHGSPEHFLLEKVEGYTEVREGRAEVLAGAHAPDPATLEVNLSQPYAELPAVLAHSSAGSALLPERPAGASAQTGSRFVCTGPYRIERPWRPGQDIRLIRFSGYYAKNPAFAGGGAGQAGRIVFEQVSGEAEAFDMFERGEAHVAPLPINRIAAYRHKGQISSGPSGYVSYIGLPAGRSPYDNPDFRKALALSIDRGPILKGLSSGSRSIPTGFLPESAGPVSRQDDCTGVLKPEADLRAAKQALSASGLKPPGSVLPVYTNSGGGHDRWLEPVARQWKDGLGIEAKLSTATWSRYLEFLVQPGPDGPFRMAWTVKYPSPEAMLQPLFESGSLDNFSRFSNPEFDGLLLRARMTSDRSSRQQIYGEAARLLCSQVPVIPMWFGENHYVFAPGWRASGGRPADRVDVFGDPVLRELSTG